MGCCFGVKEDVLREDISSNNSSIAMKSKGQLRNSTILKAQSYKSKGNQYFKTGQYDRALKQYQKAIKQNPTDAKFYTNLSVCYRKQENWKGVFQSSKKGLQCDKDNKKAQLFKAISLAELSKDAPNLTQKFSKVQQSQTILNILKNNPQFQQQASAYLTKLGQLKKAYQGQKLTSSNSEFSNYLKQKLECSQTNNQILEFYQTKQHMIKQMNMYVNKYENQQVPDYFQDPINFQIYTKPFILNTGLTYEASILDQHFRAHGFIDPITKQPVFMQNMIENKNLKQLIASHPKITKWKIIQTSQNPKFITF